MQKNSSAKHPLATVSNSFADALEVRIEGTGFSVF